MVKVFIQGLSDGEHEVDLSVPTSSIEGLNPEYTGDIAITGQLLIHHRRFALDLEVKCEAKLNCDLSLKEYNETISFEYKTSFIANGLLYFEQKKRDLKSDEERAIADDEKYLDITDDIREELAVHLPMKRIAPEFRDKNFEDIFPQFSEKKSSKKSKDKEIDDRWSALKNIKLN